MMQIGNIQLHGQVIAAPMAGATDACYRRILCEYGAALLVTEMISAKGLLHGNAATRELLRVCDKTAATSAQLFGNDPAIMERAAFIIADDFPDIDIIDINCGCPAPKIVKNGEGSALMRDPELIGRIVRAVARAQKPVTVKIRKGFGKSDNTAIRAALAAADAGAAAICVHGRTASQMYSGKADWDVVAGVVACVKNIPVVGNGDILSPDDAAARIKSSGCDAVMIGRGMWGNPWLVKQTDHYLKTGQLLPTETPAERVAAALRHTRLLIDRKGPYIGLRESRTHLHMYTKGLPGAAAARVRINEAGSFDEVAGILRALAAGS